MRAVLVNLHDVFLEKLLCKVKSCIVTELAQEQNLENVVNDDYEFK